MTTSQEIMMVFLDIKSRKLLSMYNIEPTSKLANTITNSLKCNPMYMDSVYMYLNRKFSTISSEDIINNISDPRIFGITIRMLYDVHNVGHLRSIKVIPDRLSVLYNNFRTFKTDKSFFVTIFKLSLQLSVLTTLFNHKTCYETTYDKIFTNWFKTCYTLFNSSIEPFKIKDYCDWIKALTIIVSASGTVSKSEPKIITIKTLNNLTAKYKTDGKRAEDPEWLTSVVVKRADLISWDHIQSMGFATVFIWDEFIKYRKNYI